MNIISNNREPDNILLKLMARQGYEKTERVKKNSFGSYATKCSSASPVSSFIFILSYFLSAKYRKMIMVNRPFALVISVRTKIYKNISCKLFLQGIKNSCNHSLVTRLYRKGTASKQGAQSVPVCKV